MAVPAALRRLWAGVLALALSLLCAPAATAQADVFLAGRITGPEGQPAAGAQVRATAETGAAYAGAADATGEYRLRLPERGAYVVSVQAPGLQPATRVVTGPPAAGEEWRADFVLELRMVTLTPLEVRVPRLTVEGATRWTPGSVEQSRTGMSLRTEPLGSDPVSDATQRQVGLAVGTGDGGGISIAGQAPDQTRLTMDGADLGSGGIPREAVRAVGATTNTYDVGRGRFTGGQVDVQTQRAGNSWGGAVRVEGRDPRLQYGENASTGLDRRASHLALDVGGGGALIRDRLFAFGALAARRSDQAALSLGGVSPAGLERLGISPDSVRRFLDVTRPLRPAAHEGSSASGYTSGLLRLDAVLSARHSLMLRLNGQDSRLPDAGSASAVAGTGNSARGSEFGVLARLSSGGTRVANELTLHRTSSSRAWSVADPAPSGVVNLSSEADGTGLGLAALRFAGSAFDPRDTRQASWQVSDRLVVTTADRRHRVRLGAEVGEQRHTRLPATSRGAFVYASLADLEQGRPALFTRSFDEAERTSEVRRVAFFTDDHWRPDGLELSYGLRAERSWYPRMDGDPAVGAAFGRMPGAIPPRWRLSPRLGFSFERRMPWNRSPEGRTAIQGGIGEFSGELPLAALGSALAETGLSGATELICAGPAAPTPDWEAYRADPSSVPTTCADGSESFASRLPRTTLFARDFVPPRVWRASVHGQGLLDNGIIWSTSTSLVLGTRQPVAFDRNLRPEPGFANGDEGGRPVYVSPEAIDPVTGAVAFSASRRFAEFGTVREVTAEGRSRAAQLSTALSRFYGPGAILGPMRVELGYTWTAARETVGPIAAPARPFASTAGDASALEWAPAPHSPRHMFHAYAESRMAGWLTIAAVGRLSSGVPFTPMVSGDVNGDGAFNDRAFVFDPAGGALDEAGSRAMGRLLDDGPAGVRTCLGGQTGRIAAHNSCRTPWTPLLDLNARMQLGPRIEGSTHRRVSVWIAARNLTAGLDYLLHGSDGLRGWGQFSSVDNTLLSVRGFDPASRRFRYDVNPRFGSISGFAIQERSPLSVSVQVRVVLGSDRILAEFRDARNAAAGNRDQALSPDNIRLHLQQQLFNVPGEVLALNGPQQLDLTPAQALRLQAAADSLRALSTPLVDALVDEIAVTGGNGPRWNAERVRELAQQASELRQVGADIARTVLTPEQWAKVPERLHSFGRAFSPYPPQRLTPPTEF